MVDRDFLERMDAHLIRGNEHMARGNEHMARGNEHMARGNVLMDQVKEEVRLTREFMATALTDQRTFTQQMIARVDRIVRDNARALDGMTGELRRLNDRCDRRAAEQLDESRAHREALLTVRDRMERLDPPPSDASA